MEKSFPFNAHLSNGTYDRIYTADDLALERGCYISDGILTSDSLRVSAADYMNITVSAGSASIKGRTYINTEPLVLALEPASALLPRIDSIVLKLDLFERVIKAYAKTGICNSMPEPPPLDDDGTVKEIALADIYVAANAAAISGSQITDRRVPAKYPVDFEKLYDEYRADLEKRLNLVSDGDGKKALFNDGQYKSTGEMKELKRFTVSGTFNPVNYPSKNNMYLIVIVGGGGGGVYGGNSNLGGASGDIKSLMLSLADKNYRVTVGAGGAWSYEDNGNPGGNTQFEFYTANGGVSGVASVKDRLDYITAFGGVYPSKSAKTKGGVNMLGIGSGGNYKSDGDGKNGICIVYGFA